jgi:esterase
MDYDSMAIDVLHTIKTLGLTEVHMVGHSMGGKVAAATALKEYAQVNIKSLTMMDISPVHYPEEEFTSVSDTVTALHELNAQMTPQTTKEEMSEKIAGMFEDKPMRAFINSNLQITTNGQLRWNFNIDGIHTAMASIRDFTLLDVASQTPHKFEGPMLLLKGSDSNFVRSSHISEVEKLFPLYNLVSIRQAGHWLHADKPEETVQRVESFICSVEEYYSKKQMLAS